MIKNIFFIGRRYLLHRSCGKKGIESNKIKPKPKPPNPPYNHCSLCGKWLGFFSYLQFGEKFKVCAKCEKG